MKKPEKKEVFRNVDWNCRARITNYNQGLKDMEAYYKAIE